MAHLAVQSSQHDEVTNENIDHQQDLGSIIEPKNLLIQHANNPLLWKED